MKKILVFIAIFVIIVSISSFSVATVKNGSHLSSGYMGMWKCDNDDSANLLNIGYSEEYDMFIVQKLDSVRIQGTINQSIDYNMYSLTYDEIDDIYYLTNTASEMAYKMKLSDDKENLYLTSVTGEILTFELVKRWFK